MFLHPNSLIIPVTEAPVGPIYQNSACSTSWTAQGCSKCKYGMKRKDAKHPPKSDCLAHWCQRIGSQVLVVLGIPVGHIQISDCILIVGRIREVYSLVSYLGQRSSACWQPQRNKIADASVKCYTASTLPNNKHFSNLKSLSPFEIKGPNMVPNQAMHHFKTICSAAQQVFVTFWNKKPLTWYQIKWSVTLKQYCNAVK